MSEAKHLERVPGRNSALILASASPRRRQLLELIGLSFQIVPSMVEEAPLEGEDPQVFAIRTARAKALDVVRAGQPAPVLGADTVVEIDGLVLGKPGSAAVAAEMLHRLSGRMHRVHTALALAHNGKCSDLIDTATVRFAPLNDEIVRWYVATGEGIDKAGSYAIQGQAGAFVTGIDGSPHTVVGLPLHRLPELFAEHDLDFWSRVTSAEDP